MNDRKPPTQELERATTLRVIADRADDDTVIVEPQETSRPELRVEGSPGATALKLLHLMHDEAGVAIAEDVEHDCPIAQVRSQTGIRNLTVNELEHVLEELVKVRLLLRDIDARGDGKVKIGTLVDRADIDVQADHAVRIVWRFGSLFRQEAARSDHWSMIDKPVLMALRSRYAIALLEHLSGLAWRTYRAEQLTVDEVRRILGVAPGRLRTFAHLRQRALDPGIRELNELSRFHVEYDVDRTTGRQRKIIGIVLKWDLRETAALAPQLALPNGSNRDAAPDSTKELEGSPRPKAMSAQHEPFPSDGAVRWDEYWAPLARRHGQGRDVDRLGEDFVGFCQRRGIPLDAKTITKTFVGFCQRQRPVT